MLVGVIGQFLRECKCRIRGELWGHFRSAERHGGRLRGVGVRVGNLGGRLRLSLDPIGVELWAMVHGLASLLITKPWLPWGDIDDLVEQSLRVVTAGCAMAGRTADLTIQQLSAQLPKLKVIAATPGHGGQGARTRK